MTLSSWSPRLRGFETLREGAPTWARNAIAATRAGAAAVPGPAGVRGGVAPAQRPVLGARGLAGELAVAALGLGFLSASAGGGMGMILICMLVVGLALSLAVTRLVEWRWAASAHPGGELRPAFALAPEGIALEQAGRLIAVPWSDVLEIVALPPRGLGRHGARAAFVVSPHRRSRPWIEVVPSRFGLTVWELLPEAERLHQQARRSQAGGPTATEAPYRSSGREELGARARDLADDVSALAGALVRSQPLPGCFRVPMGLGRGAVLLTPHALCYLLGAGRGRAPAIHRVPWSDVCELSVDGGALRVHMHEPDDDLRLSLGYPALLIAAVAAAYLRGAVPLSRV